MSNLLDRLFEAVRMLPWKRIGEFFRLLILHERKAFIISICLLFISAALVVWYRYRATEYENIVRSTIQADMMATPQRFKGLEAFIMSSLKLESGLVNDLGEREISGDYIAIFKRLQARLTEVANIEAKQTQLAQCNQLKKDANCEGLKREIKQFHQKSEWFLSPKLHIAAGANDGLILTDDDKNGFLFLPINILRQTLTGNIRDDLKFASDKNKIYQEKIRPLIEEDQELKTEIAITRYLAPDLKAFIERSIAVHSTGDDTVVNSLTPSPAQVYIITKSGILRIFNNRSGDPEEFYGRQFPANTFFPSRPYFWPAFQDKVVTKGMDNFEPKPGSKLKDYFYISQPYMDLGGNGIVITLTHGVLIDGFPQMAICFDLQFREKGNEMEVATALRERVSNFGGTVVKIKCSLSTSKSNCTAPELEANETLSFAQDKLRKKMENFLANYGEKNSEVFGNIQVINPKEVTTGHELQVAVPIGAESPKQASQEGTFLLFNLDLSGYRQNTQLIFLGACTTFGLMTVLLAYLWGTTVRHKREYKDAFDRVATVMYNSPTPYIHLNSKDQICDLSISFCKLLGYAVGDNESIKKSMKELKRKKFRSLCSEDSIEEYDRIQKLRAERETVKPYKLNLKKVDRTLVAVQVVSADIPSTEAGAIPETFGIFLDANSVIYPHFLEGASNRDDDTV